jgi:dimeric dUTPase (all-alpha-NTP-PPase superfamily)
MFFTEQKFNELLTAQETLNVKYSGQDWFETKHPIHFLTAILTETAEFFESAPRAGIEGTTGWKFWKPYLENDEQNMKVEIVDVLHFVMSIILIVKHKYNIDVNEELINRAIMTLQDRRNIHTGEEFTVFHLYYGLLALGVTNMSVFEYDDHGEDIAETAIGFLITSFKQINASPDDVFDWYFKKNALNVKRIEGGYLAGEYQKYSSDGTEDNRSLDLT